jgi:hypothetical protein
LTPNLDVVAGIDGSVVAGISTSVSQTANITAGFQYLRPNWKPISSFSNQFTFEQPQFTNGVSFTAYVGPQMSFTLNGVLSPYLKANLALKLDNDPLSDPWVTFKGGLEVVVGINVKIFSIKLLDYQAFAIDFWKLLYSISNPNFIHPLVGRWLDPDTSGTVTTIEWQNDGYVVVSIINPNRGGNELTWSSYINGVFRWEYCPPGMYCITSESISPDTLVANWWNTGGFSGTTYYTRIP